MGKQLRRCWSYHRKSICFGTQVHQTYVTLRLPLCPKCGMSSSHLISQKRCRQGTPMQLQNLTYCSANFSFQIRCCLHIPIGSGEASKACLEPSQRAVQAPRPPLLLLLLTLRLPTICYFVAPLELKSLQKQRARLKF